VEDKLYVVLMIWMYIKKSMQMIAKMDDVRALMEQLYCMFEDPSFIVELLISALPLLANCCDFVAKDEEDPFGTNNAL